MMLTVAELKRAIEGLPDTLPVKIECAKVYMRNGHEEGDANETDTDFADGVEFQGNHVLITCPP